MNVHSYLKIMSTEKTQSIIIKSFIRLVAKKGFHGTSMSMIAKEAGIAIGTSYVHFSSKEELINQTYVWIKRGLAENVIPGLSLEGSAQAIYQSVWMDSYKYFSKHQDQARYITQIEESPYYEVARKRLKDVGDPFVDAAAHKNFADAIVSLPYIVFHNLSIGVAVRLAASDARLSNKELKHTMDATWRAISRPNYKQPKEG